MLFRSFLFLSFFLPCLGFGHTLVISDIDDTIKESKVLSLPGKLEEALDTDSFWLMPQLYRSINADQFFYVSAAPYELMHLSHERFLEKNEFPAGELILPKLNQIRDFKIRTISALLRQHRPSFVILIGDNGEKDPAIYKYLVDNFKDQGVQFLTFIRMNYDSRVQGSPLEEGQIPFVSAAEIFLALYHLQLRQPKLSLVKTESFQGLMLSALRRPGLKWTFREVRFPGSSIGLPEWVNCIQHQPHLRVYSYLAPDWVSLLERKIYQRCSIGAIDP